MGILDIRNQAHFDKVREFAASIGKLDNLLENLERLKHFGSDDDKSRCVLIPDLAPYSFYFSIDFRRGDDWKTWIVGGLIFHGTHDNGGDGGAPTYSVSLSPADGWSIHT